MSAHLVRRLRLALPALLLASILAVAFRPAPAPGALEGTVRDAANGQPLPGAMVTFKKVASNAVTDSKGYFRIEHVPAGTYDVVFSYIGYEAQTLERIVILDGATRTLNVRLQPVSIQPQEVFVLDESEPARQQVRNYSLSGIAQKSIGGGFHVQHNTEDYAAIEENTWRDASGNPLSTFSIDVDAASYSNIRRFIDDRRLPPPDAVRVEEMINYFAYDYPDPTDEQPFSITTEVGAAPWAPAHRLVHIGLQGRRLSDADRPASNLVFLLDVSGSMNSPDKLPLLKQAFELLAEQLRPQDRVAIVVYAGAAGLVLPSTAGDEKQTIRDAIARLEAGGSTAGAAGIELAYRVAKENHISGGINRVILATDGDFNVGASSDGALVRMIEEKREQGTFLTVLGFGTGNLKDNKMEQLADHGNGAYYYIDNRLEAEKVLVRELGGTLQTIAKDVKIQVEFNPAHVQAYRLIGYENRLLAAEDFADDTKDAGELGAGHSVTALYEVVPVGATTDVAIRSTPDLRYQTPRTATDADGELLFVKLRYKQPDAERSRLVEQPLAAERDAALSADFHFAAAVAGFGMILRDSEHKGIATLEQVLALADDGRGTDAEGYRAAFIDLVERYRQLADPDVARLNDR